MKVKHKLENKVFTCHLFDGTNLPCETVKNEDAKLPVENWYFMELTSPSGEKVRADVAPGMLILEDDEGNKTAVHPVNFGEYEEVAE